MVLTLSASQSSKANTVEALWTLIQSQPKKVRQVLSLRLFEDAMFSKHGITPALATQIRKAREEYLQAKTIRCTTPEELQNYFDSL